MKLHAKWLRNHLDSPLTINAILNQLQNLGFELKSFKSQPNLWQKIKIVKILNKEKHPNADKLHIYSIQKASGEIIKIVCGDVSLEVGDCVPYAFPGIIMPSGLELTIANIRGIDSPGMLCGPSELDLTIEHNGVLKCHLEDFGKSIAEAYEDEGIFELEVTPNRGDALSALGIARVLANANLGTLKDQKYNDFLTSEEKFFNIKSENCLGLLCSFFKHTIQDTPAEIAKKLQLTQHTVTNLDVVDLTNYIAHDLGQPMHVFDYDKIKNSPCSIEEITVAREFQTLGHQTVTLEQGTLAFTSGQSVISWPGIIGGENSKVDKNTTSILLETGVFKIDSIQRRKHGIITSAAKKFEYGINPFALHNATNAFFSKLNEKPISQQSLPFRQSKQIKFNFHKVKEILGDDISEENFIQTMERQGFILEKQTVTPPGHKFFDINTENCIIEEFATYQNSEIKSINLPPKYNTSCKNIRTTLQTIAILEGFHECKHISLGQAEHHLFNIPQERRKVYNISNQNHAILRGTLLPGLLNTFSWHCRNNEKIFQFFEEGLIYGEFDNKQKKGFTALSNEESSLQRLLSKIFSAFNLNPACNNAEKPYTNISIEYRMQDQVIAHLFSIHPLILKEFNISTCYGLEIMPEIFNIQPQNFRNSITNLIPIYQDCTFTLPANVSAAKIINTLNTNQIQYKILTIFPDKDLHKERKITVQFKISQEKQLTKTEIKKICDEMEELVQHDLNN